jgi:hypothetical protein
MIYVSFSMTIRDGEHEYGTPYVASINANKLSDDLIEKTLMKEVCMSEIDEPEDCTVDEDNRVWAKGDYRCVWIDSMIQQMPQEHFEIMKTYGICSFDNLTAVKEGFVFR